MKKKVSELELYEIDYLVGKAEKLNTTIKDERCFYFLSFYSPTTNPSQAWSIIEREKIQSLYSEKEGWCYFLFCGDKYFSSFGKTSLEAAMRCYVQSVCGDEVEI